MCIFSGPVEKVSATNIYARKLSKNRQILVYSMDVENDNSVAMILPLPVPKNSPEDAVRFIDLSSYKDFFKDLNEAFVEHTRGLGRSFNDSDLKSAPRLKVHKVGDFEASFVPSLDDMDRLDPRFTLPRRIWSMIPEYDDYGFAVFKLSESKSKDRGLYDQYGRRRPYAFLKDEEGGQTIHPMAFEFPTTLTNKIYFPTVHIHDGKVHPKEEFDHSLFLQGADVDSIEGFKKSGSLKHFMKDNQITENEKPCYRAKLKGSLPNEDTIIEI